MVHSQRCPRQIDDFHVVPTTAMEELKAEIEKLQKRLDLLLEDHNPKMSYLASELDDVIDRVSDIVTRVCDLEKQVRDLQKGVRELVKKEEDMNTEFQEELGKLMRSHRRLELRRIAEMLETYALSTIKDEPVFKSYYKVVGQDMDGELIGGLWFKDIRTWYVSNASSEDADIQRVREKILTACESEANIEEWYEFIAKATHYIGYSEDVDLDDVSENIDEYVGIAKKDLRMKSLSLSVILSHLK